MAQLSSMLWTCGKQADKAVFLQMYIFYQDRSSVTHDCVNLVVLLLFPCLPLPVPLAIFPEQFACFRQRKAKGDVAQSQKKAAKRKGSAVHTHDLPKEEHPVAARGAGKGLGAQAEDTNLPEARTEAQVNFSVHSLRCTAGNKCCRWLFWEVECLLVLATSCPLEVSELLLFLPHLLSKTSPWCGLGSC